MQRDRQMQVELVIIALFDRSKSLQLSNKIVSIRRGSQRSQRSDDGWTHGVIVKILHSYLSSGGQVLIPKCVDLFIRGGSVVNPIGFE